MSNIRFEFIMSQIQHIRDIKENEKTKISSIFYEGCQGLCIFKICKNRNLSEVYQALMEVRHPNLAVVYDCVYENGNTYVIEEYIPGKTLAEILEEKGTFSEKETARIMIELCSGLEILHRHEPPVIHNDIKTSNIMIREDGIVKLFDFDISRTYKEGSNKNTKLMGTYEYAAPEHYGFGQSEPCTDIYSLGVTMHEMLTDMGLNHEHNVTHQGSLAKIIRKCVEIDRKRRYASAALLKSDLEKYQISNGHILRIIMACICAVLLLTACGIFLNNHLRRVKEPQDAVGMEGNDSQKGSEEDESIVMEGNDSEEDESIVTEGNDSEEDENIGTEGGTGNSNMENTAGNNNSVGNETNTEADNNEISSQKKPIKTIYNIQGTLLSMDAWTDGTFLLLEEISGNFYLRSSDGKEKLLGLAQPNHGVDLGCDPYTNKMYLVFSYFDGEFIYSVNKELEIELFAKLDYGDGTGGKLAFLSDGTLVYDSVLVDSNDGTWLGDITYRDRYDYLYFINDKVYGFNTNYNAKTFLELDAEGKVVKEFTLEDGISMENLISFGDPNIIYNNSKAVYFMVIKDEKLYLYCFDGETYEAIACLHDYEGSPFSSYFTYLCVTDTAFGYYNYEAILEFSLE